MSANPEKIVSVLRASRAALCTVESCTGGLIAHLLTQVSGSSEVFWGGIVSYDNSAKHFLLGVSPELIQKHGAVSEEVAAEMARQGLIKMRDALNTSAANIKKPEALICIATTGIAGPTGGTPEKPVGLCYIGLAGPWTGLGEIPVRTFKTQATPGRTRAENKESFASHALEQVLKATTSSG